MANQITLEERELISHMRFTGQSNGEIDQTWDSRFLMPPHRILSMAGAHHATLTA